MIQLDQSGREGRACRVAFNSAPLRSWRRSRMLNRRSRYRGLFDAIAQLGRLDAVEEFFEPLADQGNGWKAEGSTGAFETMDFPAKCRQPVLRAGNPLDGLGSNRHGSQHAVAEIVEKIVSHQIDDGVRFWVSL